MSVLLRFLWFSFLTRYTTCDCIKMFFLSFPCRGGEAAVTCQFAPAFIFSILPVVFLFTFLPQPFLILCPINPPIKLISCGLSHFQNLLAYRGRYGQQPKWMYPSSSRGGCLFLEARNRSGFCFFKVFSHTFSLRIDARVSNVMFPK